jgi:RNA-directed DNA polymerase
MNLESDKRLKFQLRLDFSSAPTGEARQVGREDIESLSAVNEPERPASTSRTMEEICERTNLKEALRQVRGNKGSAGIDGMTVDQLGDYLKQHWPAIREQLLNGTYEPNRCGGWKSRSRMEEGCESLASQPGWIASSSKR